MKNYIVSFALILIMAASTIAQTAPPAPQDQLSSLWKQKKYTELGNLLDAKTSASPPDIVALYCSKFFYVFIQPNKTKALAAVTKLKQTAEATTDAEFIAFANGELAEVQGIPDAEFVQPSAEILAVFHNEFADEYPNIDVGSRLKTYQKP